MRGTPWWKVPSRLWPPSPSALFYGLVALLATAPAWIVKYPPLTDLPFHLATIRVMRSLHDPAFGMDGTFFLALGRTQYLLYYFAGVALSYVMGVTYAGVALVAFYLGGTVLGMRSLLLALGRDERLCLLTVPLLVNVLFLFGLLPFLLGVPLALFGLAAAVRYFDDPTPARGVLVGVLALAVFYSHIFMFGIFGLGFAVLFPWGRPFRWVRYGAPTVPALVMLVYWSRFTAAGRLTSGALSLNAGRKTLAASFADFGHWLTDVWSDESDEIILVATVLVALLSTGLAIGDREERRPGMRAFALLPAACLVLFLLLPEQHGYIWLIAQRFPLLFALSVIPLLRVPRGFRGLLITAVMMAVAATSVVSTCRKFIQFQLTEVGDFDDALAALPMGKKVCALIYDRGSRLVSTPPFLHFGSYYQVQKGGVVMFTYAGYAHWPVDFLPGQGPPPGGPARLRWEWTPEQVPVRGELYPYYDYVLTRGHGFSPPPGTFRLAWRGDKWNVWQREEP